MQPLSFEQISPLITDLQSQGRTVRVIFQCPVSGDRVQASHNLRQENNLRSQITKSAQNSMFYSAQNAIAQVIRNIFGSNPMSRTANTVARQTIRSMAHKQRNNLSEDEKKEAIIKAFQNISSRFIWDKNRSRWISAKSAQQSLSAFEQQLNAHPIQHSYDQKILARMLVEVALSDGVLSTEEHDWLTEFLGIQTSIESLKESPKVSSAELQQISQGGIRQSILMIVWTLALTDELFAEQEENLLRHYASGMSLSPLQIGNARQAAQIYILDQAMERIFTWGGHDTYSRQQLIVLAEKIGMSQQQAMLAEAKFQRRQS